MFRPVAVLILLALAGAGWGARSTMADTCDPAGADAAPIADARLAVAASCDCTGASSHSEYVRCSKQVVSTRINLGQLNGRCRGVVQQCARRSVCGRPGAVSC